MPEEPGGHREGILAELELKPVLSKDLAPLALHTFRLNSTQIWLDWQERRRWPTQVLADQSTLSQSEKADYAPHITPLGSFLRH